MVIFLFFLGGGGDFLLVHILRIFWRVLFMKFVSRILYRVCLALQIELGSWFLLWLIRFFHNLWRYFISGPYLPYHELQVTVSELCVHICNLQCIEKMRVFIHIYISWEFFHNINQYLSINNWRFLLKKNQRA